jgi:glycine/serine hydroxymethyltransferase
MGTDEMQRIAVLIDRALFGAGESELARIRRDVEALAEEFPLYAPAREPVAR